ncbi:SusC/RagA family TonB-linked outer membrane protein [Desertivirga arenae]|uniref:SusC/RagA family TonB-linked outer membrane protein n=1 Tax=Desertivirga arenae TaxID=2810309 RepID=UPI001A9677F6|nr:SusC/RagA family TonB-linked outer membrane protein [Pedobacter sp. SYSU D00823]
MKLTAVLLLASILQISAASKAQTITYSQKTSSLKEFFKEVRRQTGYNVVWLPEKLHDQQKLKINLIATPLERALEQVLSPLSLNYEIVNQTVVVKEKELSIMEKLEKVFAAIDVEGKVVDESSRPLAGASVSIKGKGKAIITDAKGFFRMKGVDEKAVIEVSYIGYKTMTMPLKGINAPLLIKLQRAEVNMSEVVVTGTGITRNRNTFTGATAAFSADQIKAVGNNNVIQSLKTLDPSFILLENNLSGANPNVLPQIQLRGGSSIPSTTLRDEFATDPNQPLFILDGFETTLQTIVDLDINRIGSVTILKDAASTALYGARASNGVVVVETIRPKPGQLNLSYSNDVRFELPDLSGYNMMNAAEKLEFERLSGRYTYFTSGSPANELYLEELYNSHLAAVRRGVDTYWLNEPVRNGLTENNSIFAQGGDNSFTYGVGANYKTQSGAMKGSGRDTWSGNINLTYRKGKVNVNNVVYIRGFNSANSPYGSFSNFVNANPYFVKDPTQQYLEVTRISTGATYYVENPLYDASLPNFDKSKNLEVQNNFNLTYSLSPSINLKGGFQVIKGDTERNIFKSPESSDFRDIALLKRGAYTEEITSNLSYQGNLLLSYGRVINGIHTLSANARAEVNNREKSSSGFVAEGFPEGSTGNPRFAYGYAEGEAPRGGSSVYRTLNGTLSLNYAFDQRYLFDASYRIDGSTAFGSNKQFSPYWSAGAGWNIKNEAFLKKAGNVDRLKIYANIGVTGNQNYGDITSVSVYNYNDGGIYNQFGQGLTLGTLGNPDLAPQKTTQISGGMDYSFFQNRISGNLNVYSKKTDPLVVVVDMPSSTGIYGYPLNAGTLSTHGAEFRVAVMPVRNMAKNIQWSVNAFGSTFKSRYKGFGKQLASLNREQELNKSLVRYLDGYSPNDLWAVKSLGIDPATGRELFLTADGQYTFDYSLGNVQVVGNSTPTLEGVFGTSLTYKGWNMAVNLRYSLGADIFNSALFNKVENISYTDITFNQDKRALYERWKQPGDNARFKAISQTSVTEMSSRFVQEENLITGESISLGYTFINSPFVRRMGMKSLNFSAITNDIFRASTVKRERGIDYPFANTISFSLRSSF